MGGLPSQGGGGPKELRHIKISDQPIDVKVHGHVKTSVSGNIVQVVNASGQCLCVNISGTTIVDISGQIVQISGQGVLISGQAIVTDSGSVTSVSGNIVQIVNASGQCLCANISGDVVNISGQTVITNLSGQTINIITVPTNPVNDFNHATNVPAGNSNTHTYTTTGSFKLSSVEASASGAMKVEIKAGNTGTETTRMVGFTVDSNLIAQLRFHEELQLTSGQSILVIRTNRELQATDVFSTILGFNS